MDTLTISQTAEATGFPASTLRFYEDAGLVVPDRSPNGYRSYDTVDVERLRFIGRAKSFGLALDDIADLVALLDAGDCEPVHGRLRELVETRIGDTRRQAHELAIFTADLEQVRRRLDAPASDGPCDDDCSCATEVPTVEEQAPALSCTLSPTAADERRAAWQSVVRQAERREPTARGIRLRFDRDADAARLATLAADEQRCCSFFEFVLTIDGDGVTLEVGGPDEARSLIDALAGARS